MQERERRLFKRVKRNLYVQCHLVNSPTPWVSATVRDISKAGVSISITKRLNPSDILEMRMVTFLRSQPIQVLGKVVSCKEAGEIRPSWVAHISFTEINRQDKPIFQEIIQAFLQQQ